MRLIEHFDRGAERFPERAFLVDEHGSLSYAAARLSSHRIANALTRAGLRPGVKAAVYSANAARSFECVMGIIRAGLVWVPINVRNSIEDSAFTLGHCEVELLFYQRAYADNVAALRARCPAVRTAVCIDGDAARFARRVHGRLRGCLCRRAAGSGRRRDAVQLRRHLRPAQGRDDAEPQLGGDDAQLPDPDARREPGAPGRGADDACGRWLGTRLCAARHDQRHAAGLRAQARHGGDRASPRHPSVPAADRHLPPAGAPGRAPARLLFAALLPVLLGADVHCQAEGGGRDLRPRHDQWLRPDGNRAQRHVLHGRRDRRRGGER